MNHDKRIKPSNFKIVLLMTVAVASVSASAIFIRLAQAPALSIALWRNVLALAILAPFILRSKQRRLHNSERISAIVSGVFLAAHFGFWISSLEHTTVSASVVLVCTQPIFVAIVGAVFLKEGLSPLRFFGILISVCGAATIAFASGFNRGQSFGNILALLGAITVAGYVLIGRKNRKNGTPLFRYVAHVYSSATLTLLLVCFIMDVQMFSLDARSWFWIALVAIFPQVIGHTTFNWALGYVPAAVLSSVILIEPVVSTAFAFAVFNEVPHTFTFIGSAITLGGLGFVVFSKSPDAA